ncbi:MAG: response regulator [Desulfobulbus sp.]|nr:response regulator [Desulfobulbus sp.]
MVFSRIQRRLEEAIARLGSEWCDVIVSDLVIPGMDGFQVFKAAKRKDAGIAVILLTGFGAMDTVIDALRLGADDFVRKSCEIDEMSWCIGNCLEKQALQRKVALYERVLPVCGYCGKIRHDQPGAHGQGPWYDLEEYLRRAKGVNLSFPRLPPGMF